MLALKITAALVAAYLLGSIPFGLIIAWLASGRDVRFVESGRTGGTNVMRTAGLVAGVLTALMDVIKGAAAGWLAAYLLPGSVWLPVAAALLSIIGHNYSLFLLERNPETGLLRFRGGAGGATCLGGAIGLWGPAWMFIIPMALLVFVFIGYASVTTMSIALVATIIFAYRAAIGLGPWSNVVYGLIALALLVVALRPNITRLRQGTERLVGLRAYLKKKAAEKKSADKKPRQKMARQTS